MGSARSPSATKRDSLSPTTSPATPTGQGTSLSPPTSGESVSGVARRSLGILAQRFVMMFLVSDHKVVLLEDAAEKLIYAGDPEGKRHKSESR